MPKGERVLVANCGCWESGTFCSGCVLLISVLVCQRSSCLVWHCQRCTFTTLEAPLQLIVTVYYIIMAALCTGSEAWREGAASKESPKFWLVFASITLSTIPMQWLYTYLTYDPSSHHWPRATHCGQVYPLGLSCFL